MKVKITKVLGHLHDNSEIGTIHLTGAIDTTACGLANEDFKMIGTTKPITCETCKTFLAWAKRTAKIKN